jgi:hypothetical protein
MELDGTDAIVARDRLLQELAGITDVETGQALWRAAARYHWKDRMERAAGCDTSRPSPARVQGALGGARELMAE